MIKNRPFFRRYKTTFYNFRDRFYCSGYFMNFSKIENQQKIEKTVITEVVIHLEFGLPNYI
jgi:hypothetical protein